uniref:Si:ch211-199g17.9 n=1 Tax=Astyanax mexicanus TaxID=7994 RepID=A0A3B1KDD4_ASTMX
SDNEPKIEELLKKLKKLQQKLDLEEDVKEAYSLKNTLHDEEDASIEVLKLQEMLNEKNTCRSLQLKCEDLEQESQQFELKQQKEELAGQYGCQIQETKLRHRKIMKFENHLQQLMGQHKNLYTVFTPERLSTEIQSAEYATQQLLKAQQMLEQVAHLQEQLNKAQATDSVKRMHDELFTKILHS